MYGDQGQFNSLFVMLYGGVAIMAFLSCIYLIFSRSNIIQPSIKPPRSLRLWAAAFLAAMFASHVWWLVIGSVWLTDDRFVAGSQTPPMACICSCCPYGCLRCHWNHHAPAHL